MTSFMNSAPSSLFAAIVLVGSATGGMAQDSHGAMQLGGFSHCSSYGPDFAAVEGSNTCVKIGGRVRVQLGTNASLHPDTWHASHAAPATLRSDSPVTATANHLRIRGGLEGPLN